MNSPEIKYYGSIEKNLLKAVSKFHMQKITYLKYLPNGFVASCSADFTVNIWDPFTWASIRKYSEHVKEVFCIDQINMDTLVSAGLDGTMRVWKISTGQTLSKIDLPSPTYVVRSLSNGLIACGLYGLTEKNLIIYNFTSQTVVTILNGHLKTLYSIEMFRDDLMASGSYDTKVITWNLTTYTEKYNFTGHKDRVYCIKKLSSNLVASADRSGVILIWDWLTRNILHKLTGHTNTLWTSSLDLFESDILVSGSQDKTIKFWNISSGALIESIDVGIQINALTMLKKGSVYNLNEMLYFRDLINEFVQNTGGGIGGKITVSLKPLPSPFPNRL
jgi:WD40 repeat protein